MHLLLTNDDGIHAEGMKYLHKATSAYQRSIVAPDFERSGCSTSISIRTDLSAIPTDTYPGTTAIAISGTPADCMKIALSDYLIPKPDWILSGINKGSNAGRNTFYSGTVGALIEGALHGIPGIAFSCVGHEERGFEVREGAYDTAVEYIPSILEFFFAQKIPEGSFINVNFPYCSKEEIAGIRLVPQSMDYWSDAPFLSKTVEGIDYYQIGSQMKYFPKNTGSDIPLLKEHFITCVPIQIRSLTDEKLLSDLDDSFKRAFS